jgi:fatty acid/phospholipid biosynthesis enzyme
VPVIAVDAMGGDHAPDEIVRGVADVSLDTDIDCCSSVTKRGCRRS